MKKLTMLLTLMIMWAGPVWATVAPNNFTVPPTIPLPSTLLLLGAGLLGLGLAQRRMKGK